MITVKAQGTYLYPGILTDATSFKFIYPSYLQPEGKHTVSHSHFALS